ncbi:MAG: hypothetical protein ACLQPD_19315 [Desulfomonilaceae bacterium]
MNPLYILMLLILSAVMLPAEHVLGQNKPCEILRADLEQKNLRLKEYVNILKRFTELQDDEMVGLINPKIAELRQQIANKRNDLEKCEEKRSFGTPDGLSSPKSETGEYATKSCSELRKRLVALVRSVHPLRRREISLISELTENEKKELREASEELKTVRQILKNRCSGVP